MKQTPNVESPQQHNNHACYQSVAERLAESTPFSHQNLIQLGNEWYSIDWLRRDHQHLEKLSFCVHMCGMYHYRNVFHRFHISRFADREENRRLHRTHTHILIGPAVCLMSSRDFENNVCSSRRQRLCAYGSAMRLPPSVCQYYFAHVLPCTGTQSQRKIL